MRENPSRIGSQFYLVGVVGFHGAQSPVVERRHDEALRKVIEMLSQHKHVVSVMMIFTWLSPRLTLDVSDNERSTTS